jgi:hypothetical protein
LPKLFELKEKTIAVIKLRMMKKIEIDLAVLEEDNFFFKCLILAELILLLTVSILLFFSISSNFCSKAFIKLGFN